MAALTLEQLRERSRAKFPITVVKNEDYTVLTPTQIAAAWTAYSGGTVGVRLKDTDDIWYKMDPDLPKANGRGLLVFGGGKQYAQRCDFADCTVGQAFPASWYKSTGGGLVLICIDKDEENGLPYVTAEFTGTGTGTWAGCSPSPGWTIVPNAEAGNGDIVCLRGNIEQLSVPVQVVSALKGSLYQLGSSPTKNIHGFYTDGVLSLTIADDGQSIDWTTVTLSFDFTSNEEFVSGASYKIFPSLISVNAAFPDHFHCINTSTSAAATIVPEIMQRPRVLDEPWWAIVECDLPPRLLANGYIHSAILDANNCINLYIAGTTLTVQNVAGGVVVDTVNVATVAAGDSIKVAIAATAQTVRASKNGAAVVVGSAAGRPSSLAMETLGHSTLGGNHSSTTFKTYSIGTGLVTDAQLIEWSTQS